MRIWVFFTQKLALLKMGLLDISPRKDTTENMGLQKKIYRFLASGVEVLPKCF